MHFLFNNIYIVYIFTNLFGLVSQLICAVKIVRGRHWCIRILARKLNGLELKFDAEINNLWRFNSASICTLARMCTRTQ